MPDGAHSHCASSEDMAVLVVLGMLMVMGNSGEVDLQRRHVMEDELDVTK